MVQSKIIDITKTGLKKIRPDKLRCNLPPIAAPQRNVPEWYFIHIQYVVFCQGRLQILDDAFGTFYAFPFRNLDVRDVLAHVNNRKLIVQKWYIFIFSRKTDRAVPTEDLIQHF
jgi:hypothetical protein